MNSSKTMLALAVAALCFGISAIDAQAQHQDLRDRSDLRFTPRIDTNARIAVPGNRFDPRLQLPGIQNPYETQLRLRYPRPVCETPRLGFHGRISCRGGMQVDKVIYGSEAWRIGLEPGDVILSVDGIRIRSDRDYQNAMRYSNGHLILRVLDARGRGVMTVHAHVETCNQAYFRGPVRR